MRKNLSKPLCFCLWVADQETTTIKGMSGVTLMIIKCFDRLC